MTLLLSEWNISSLRNPIEGLTYESELFWLGSIADNKDELRTLLWLCEDNDLSAIKKCSQIGGDLIYVILKMDKIGNDSGELFLIRSPEGMDYPESLIAFYFFENIKIEKLESRNIDDLLPIDKPSFLSILKSVFR